MVYQNGRQIYHPDCWPAPPLVFGHASMHDTFSPTTPCATSTEGGIHMVNHYDLGMYEDKLGLQIILLSTPSRCIPPPLRATRKLAPPKSGESIYSFGAGVARGSNGPTLSTINSGRPPPGRLGNSNPGQPARKMVSVMRCWTTRRYQTTPSAHAKLQLAASSPCAKRIQQTPMLS